MARWIAGWVYALIGTLSCAELPVACITQTRPDKTRGEWVCVCGQAFVDGRDMNGYVWMGGLQGLDAFWCGD
jgi:hypothetical protein